MIDIRITIEVPEGLLDALAKVEELGKTLKDGGFSERMGRVILEQGIRPYPPPPPNSTYIRTYKLFNSWQLEVPSIGGSGDLFRVESGGVEYNHLVQQRATQAWMHRGRWQTVEDVAEEREAFVATEAAAFVEGLFR